MVRVEIDSKRIDFDSSPYFIAEGGLNHNGDIKIAKKMIDEAFNCGADAIKFQTYKTEKFLADSSQYFNFFKKVELSFEDFTELYDYAKTVGISFFSSPFDFDSADFLNKIDVPCFKIASSDLTNLPFLAYIAKIKKPMIISTGLSTMEEVEQAVNVCINEGNEKLILLHCVANYPTKPEEANLSAMITMKNKFNRPVGYSDNGESILVDLVAVSLGAKVIEKHFTLNKKFDGPDHSFSIEPFNLKKLISEIKLIEMIKGDGIKKPKDSELNLRNAIRKSIYALRDMKKDEVISINNISIQRPLVGIEPKYYKKFLNRRLIKDLRKGTPIRWEDLEK